MEKYIQVMPDQEFQIEISLLPSFYLFGADDVRISLSIDYDTVNKTIIYNRDILFDNMIHAKPLIMAEVYDYNNTTEHSLISFSFGSLEGGK